jgi:hypothetical protein
MQVDLFRNAAMLLTALLSSACAKSEPSRSGAGQVRVFAPPNFLAQASPSKELGEDCSHGAAECKSGLCLHYQPNAASGFACSRKCTGDSDCPADWACQNVYPAPANEFCVPPRTWTPQVAQSR